MPLVHIDLIAGRSQEQLKALVKDVTDAIVKDTGCTCRTRSRGTQRNAERSLFGRRYFKE
jgi:hypothetical protein